MDRPPDICWSVALAPGLVLCALGAVVALVSVSSDQAPDVTWVFAFGLAIVAAGLALALIRRGLRLDHDRRVVVEWAGLLVPMVRRQTPFPGISAVMVRRENAAPPYKAPYRVLSVLLAAGDRALRIASFDPDTDQNLERARSLAGSYAEALCVDVREELGESS